MSDESALSVENPYGFVEDIDIRNSAVVLLGLAPYDVKRMMPTDLRALLKDFSQRKQSAAPSYNGLDEKHVDEPGTGTEYMLPTPVPTAVRPRASRDMSAQSFLQHHDPHNVVTPSEIGALLGKGGSGSMPVVRPQGRLQQQMIQVDPNDQALQGIGFLTVRLDIPTLLQQTDGLQQVRDVVENVLTAAADHEHSANAKHKVLTISRQVLDQEDIASISQSIRDDIKRLMHIRNYLNELMDKMQRHQQQRLTVQEELSQIPRGNCVMTVEKMQKKTHQIGSVVVATRARVDCLQIPQFGPHGAASAASLQEGPLHSSE